MKILYKTSCGCLKKRGQPTQGKEESENKSSVKMSERLLQCI